MANRCWIFQCNPERFDLLGEIARGEKGDHWSVNQHRFEITKGDRILFRISGRNAGVYATGTVLSNPYRASKSDQFGKYKVDVRYDSLLDPPILRAETDDHRTLKNLMALRGREGTNFPVSPKEEAAIVRLMHLPSRVQRRIRVGTRVMRARPIRAVPPRPERGNQRDQARIRKIEQAGIDFATDLMWRDGYECAHDAQKDGCGYDLVFKRGRSVLHVEVKGVSGKKPVFNLTRKEHECAKRDPKWHIIVVTDALSRPRHQFLSGKKLLSSLRRLEAQQYRCEL